MATAQPKSDAGLEMAAAYVMDQVLGEAPIVRAAKMPLLLLPVVPPALLWAYKLPSWSLLPAAAASLWLRKSGRQLMKKEPGATFVVSSQGTEMHGEYALPDFIIWQVGWFSALLLLIAVPVRALVRHRG